jgi:deoxyadenosine/deoxycytidine kinase
MEPEFGRSERIGDRLGEFEKRLENRLREFERRLSKQLRDMQTDLLKAFLPWQEQIRIQFRELEANTGNSVVAVKQRMDVMERRLGEIEKRLLMNPPAA